MRFDTLLEELLNELSGNEIYQKYYSKIPFDEFLNIVMADPQTVYEGGELKRMGKYAKLLIALYQKGGIRLDDVDKAKEYLGYVYKHKISLDVNKVKQLSDLYDVVKGYIAQDTKSLEEILKILPKEEYKVLHNGEKWYILQPLTEKASCYLGVDTQWCTTWGPYSLDKRYKDRGNHFTSHSNRGPLYIMINKSDPSDKYQFHFETNQFMNKNDMRIDTRDFLVQKNNKEILYYFFPSFFKEVTPEQLKLELKKMDVLPNELGLKLFEKSIGKINNPLVNALMNKDEDVVRNLIQDIYDLNIDDKSLTLHVTNVRGDVEQLRQNIGWYEYESNNGWEFVYDDVRDRGIDEYENEKLQEYLSSYYEGNKDEFKKLFSIKNFQEFIKNFFDNFVENSDIQEAFWSDIADLSAINYEEANESMINTIKKDIDIIEKDRGYEVELNLVKFIQYLLKKDITEIPDEDALDSALDGYVEYCGHDGEFERVYDFNIVYPKYTDNTYLATKTDNYFEQILENAENSGECIELRKKFNEIVDKYFKGSTTYQNDHILVRLKSNEIDCNTGMVRVEYRNKDTGETFGWRDNDSVKIDNLVSLMTNYKLFESFIKFKKNIL